MVTDKGKFTFCTLFIVKDLTLTNLFYVICMEKLMFCFWKSTFLYILVAYVIKSLLDVPAHNLCVYKIHFQGTFSNFNGMG